MMTKKKGVWVESVKCRSCNKTGLIQVAGDPTRQEKCVFCSGTGFLTTKGTISS